LGEIAKAAVAGGLLIHYWNAVAAQRPLLTHRAERAIKNSCPFPKIKVEVLLLVLFDFCTS
jgi:hypothetical protein